MKKNLNVDAMILDLRNVQEDFLDRYEQIKLDCMIALTSPRVQTLLSQHNISLDSMLCKNVPEEVSVGVVNGKVTLSSASQTAAGQVLVVNGKLMITPDAAEVLQKYACILVNGMIYCPQCLSAVVSARCILNGKLAVYPDDAVLLPGSSIKLDNTFLLRAQSRLYWNEHRFLAVDPRLDTAALAAKGCSFSAPKAILCASLAPVLAPLFPDSTELIIVPDGTAVVEDDLELTASSLRRYGTRLYVLGDAVIPAESDCHSAGRQCRFLEKREGGGQLYGFLTMIRIPHPSGK